MLSTKCCLHARMQARLKKSIVNAWTYVSHISIVYQSKHCLVPMQIWTKLFSRPCKQLGKSLLRSLSMQNPTTERQSFSQKSLPLKTSWLQDPRLAMWYCYDTHNLHIIYKAPS